MNAPPRARVTRRFDAASDEVYDAWLDVQKVRQWFGPGLGPVVCVDIGAEVGKRFEIVQRRDGIDASHGGEYLELERPRRLVFTWCGAPQPRNSRVSVDIVALGEGCELTLTHEFDADTTLPRERAEAAWGRMLDAMAAALAPERVAG